jgi:uncharacterized membrane protein YhfC
LVGWGALTFIASQVVHIPILYGLDYVIKQAFPSFPKEWALPFNAVFLGLLAGLCEEIARYVVYRRFVPTARTWKQALVFGTGHGGIEAIIFGVIACLTVAQMVALRGTDLSTLGIPAEQVPLVQQQLDTFWASPWYAGLLGALERVFAICFHISASVLVLQTFTRKNIAWLWLAVLWHAIVDGAAVIAVGTVGIYWTEAIIGVGALISLAIIFALRDRDSGLGGDSGAAAVAIGVADSTK